MHRKARAWILSHVLRKTLCEHVNGLCPAGWLHEQSITKHWLQSVRTCPYSWATGRNSTRHSLKLRGLGPIEKLKCIGHSLKNWGSFHKTIRPPWFPKLINGPENHSQIFCLYSPPSSHEAFRCNCVVFLGCDIGLNLSHSLVCISSLLK